MADEEDPSTARRALERADDRVAIRLVSVARDLPAQSLELRGDPPPDLIDAGLRVAPAVDVHEPREIREIGRLGAGHRGVERFQLGIHDGRGFIGHARHDTRSRPQRVLAVADRAAVIDGLPAEDESGKRGGCACID